MIIKLLFYNTYLSETAGRNVDSCIMSFCVLCTVKCTVIMCTVIYLCVCILVTCRSFVCIYGIFTTSSVYEIIIIRVATSPTELNYLLQM